MTLLRFMLVPTLQMEQLLQNFSPTEGRGNLINLKYRDKKVLVIDDSYNSSPASMQAALYLIKSKKEYKNVTIIKLLENVGYSKAYNYALKKIESDIYCLINNDIMVTKNWTLPIISEFINNRVDIAQPLVLDFNNEIMFK